MPRPVRPWFRFYTETPRDPKVRRLTVAQRWIWTCLLAAARESCSPGALFVAKNLPMTHQELADYAGVKVKEIGPALVEMTSMGMVHVDESGVLIVTNFQRRQYESDTSARRTRDYRDRHNTDVSDGVVTSLPSHNGRHSDGPETETETEKTSSSPRKRATKIEPEWTPGPSLIEWQRNAGIPDDLARRELPRFRDYWAGVGGDRGRKADWDATWRNWLRTAMDRLTGTTPGRRAVNEDDAAGWAR